VIGEHPVTEKAAKASVDVAEAAPWEPITPQTQP